MSQSLNPWTFLNQYAEKPERLVVGLMSGTSVDGVDAALVRISGSGRTTRAEVVAFAITPFPAKLRRKVLDVCLGGGNAETVSLLSVELGRLFADSVKAVLDLARIPKTALDAIASHGQTVSHTALKAATLQIGEPSIIAQRFGVPVVSDFRTADRAAGGQGAPLVPYADWCLLTDPVKVRAIQNIGGIGNVTYLPANAEPGKVIGFDTGPGNMLIDHAATWATGGEMAFDEDGALAADGEIDFELLETLLKHTFLQRKPPKSAGREEFGESFFNEAVLNRLADSSHGEIAFVTGRQSLSGIGPAQMVFPAARSLAVRKGIVATMTAFTALSIVDAYERHLPKMPDEVIVGGGGVRNPTLMRMLAEKLTPIAVKTHEDVGMNSDSKEAVAFAILANETLLGRASNLPSVTGASRPVVLGKLTPP